MSEHCDISNTIDKIERLSNVNGYDISIEDVDDDSIDLCFTKHLIEMNEYVENEKDSHLIELMGEFMKDVVVEIFLSKSNESVINIIMENDDDDSVTYIKMRLPKSEYVIESIYWYTYFAGNIDPFIQAA